MHAKRISEFQARRCPRDDSVAQNAPSCQLVLVVDDEKHQAVVTSPRQPRSMGWPLPLAMNRSKREGIGLRDSH